MLTAEQVEKIIADAIDSDEAQSLNRSPGSIAAEKIAELTKADTDMLVAAQALENEITSTLVDMVVATVLATMIEEEGGGRANIHISPVTMAQVMKNWDYTSEMQNGLRVVSIKMKPDSETAKSFEIAGSLMRDDDEPTGPAKPQAEPKNYGGNFWVVKTTSHDFVNDCMATVLRNCHDRADAERQCRAILAAEPGRPAVVENRYCLHIECPSTGCTQTEATSDVDKG